MDGIEDGENAIGLVVGLNEGTDVGTFVGISVGECDGKALGDKDGCEVDGALEGTTE